MNTPKNVRVSKKRARVTSISVSRLYNTGNYTNARYDVTVEIPKGVSATRTLYEVTRILASLRPIRRPSALDSLENARETPLKDLSQYQKDNLAAWQAEEKAYNDALNKREELVKKLDSLGIEETLTDAKKQWEDEAGMDVPY